jgi:multiple sugar transport system permease protein
VGKLTSPVRKVAISGAYLLVGAAIGVVIFFPILWLFSNAFKELKDIFIFPPSVFPRNPTLANIKSLFSQAPFGLYLFNSFFVSVTITVIAILIHSMAAFSFARLRFPGREVIFLCTLGTMMIPFTALIVPLFMLVRALGWVNRYAGLIWPPLFHAFGIFLFRQYYLTVPKDLEDAATLDGCSTFEVWLRVFLPLSKPIVAIGAVLFFIKNYNSFIWPLIITTKERMRVVTVGLATFQSAHETRWDWIMAGATLAAIPTIVIFIFLQRYVIQGIRAGSAKF